jgi:2-(1,2-epoxy-1,2-dihydrophenyl)acetyl-CoA isomerase
MSPPELETVALDVRDRVAWVTLNRPEALNAWTVELGTELGAALAWTARSGEVRAVVITGAGRAFSAGADLKAIAGRAAADGVVADGLVADGLVADGLVAGGGSAAIDLGAPLREVFHPTILSLRTLEKPVIAAVGGGAAGIGCSLAIASDLILAAESAYFLFTFASVGLALDGGASLLLAARAGYGRASEMALLGERVPAAQALHWGVINRVVADAELPAAAAELAARLAAGAPGAIAAIKRQLNAAVLSGLEAAMEREAALQQERGSSADFREGIAAFREKRAPTFGGGSAG